MENTRSSHCGRTFPALCRPLEDVTIRLCLKRSQKPKFQCLALDAGQTPVWYEAEELISLGACTTPNISEQHSSADVCFLSQILEEKVPEKYSLSPKACRRVIDRVAYLGREMPPLLEETLIRQAGEKWAA